MALSRQDSINKYGTEAYTGWGETEAMYDARNKGLSGGSNKYGNSLLSQMGGAVDKYVQDLISFANDDYNFAAKWIEEQYTKAAGSNDQERKDFLKSVANSLEDKVGRIQFDYQTNKYRLQGKTDLALQRLNEDEKVLKDQYNTQNQLDRENQNADLNARGIIAGTREGATGLAGKNVNNLETNITRRMDALSRSVGRDRQDILTANQQASEDLNTSARRGILDSGDQRSYDLERLQREKDRRTLEAEQERKRQKDYLASLEGSVL